MKFKGSNRDVGADYYPDQVQRLKHQCRITYNDFCRQPCAVCGLVMPPWAPPGRVKVAHHRNPAEKKHSPSALSRKGNEWWPVLVAELRMCEPLCANCHAVIHDLFDMNHYDADHLPYLAWENLVKLARREVAQWNAPVIGSDVD
jgi:hypothetical protein